MDGYASAVDHHYGTGEIITKILDGFDQADKNINSLTVDDLSPVDEFHTRGRQSTHEVAELTDIKSTDHVLDVGCGLGGTARHLAEQYKCSVFGIDLTEEYIVAGTKLTELVGLSGRVKLRQGNALRIPYDNNRFDIVWTEHVQMNIENKHGFYSELSRVLKPGGHLLFHDIFGGSAGSQHYPVPWAEEKSLSSLVTESEARMIIESVGLKIVHWKSKVRESIEFFQKGLAQIEADGPPPLGIHLLMGKNAKEKLRNYYLNLLESRVTVALGDARKDK